MDSYTVIEPLQSVQCTDVVVDDRLIYGIKVHEKRRFDVYANTFLLCIYLVFASTLAGSIDIAYNLYLNEFYAGFKVIQCC